MPKLSDVLKTRHKFLGYGRIVDFCRAHAKWGQFYPNGERPTMIAGWNAVLQEYGNDINAVDQYVGMQMEEHVPGKLITKKLLDIYLIRSSTNSNDTVRHGGTIYGA